MMPFSKVQTQLMRVAKHNYGYKPFLRFHLLNKAHEEFDESPCGRKPQRKRDWNDTCDGEECFPPAPGEYSICWRYLWFHDQEYWAPCTWLRLDSAFHTLLAEQKIQPSIGYEMYRVTPPSSKNPTSKDQKSLWEQFDMGFNPEPLPNTPAPRQEITVSRIIRDTPATKVLKELYKGCCQVCGLTLQINGKNYCEVHHLRPLGHPHDGPDMVDNMMVLCPNCHVYFDYFAVRWLEGDRVEIDGRIFTLTLYHHIAPENIAYYTRQAQDQTLFEEIDHE